MVKNELFLLYLIIQIPCWGLLKCFQYQKRKQNNNPCWALLVYRWEPSLRMTPDQALKHAWIHEPRNLKSRSRPQTLRTPRTPSLCFPSEAWKDKVQGHHHLGKKGTVSPLPIVLFPQSRDRVPLEDCMSISLNSTLDSQSTTSLGACHFSLLRYNLFQETCLQLDLPFFCPSIIRIFHFSPVFNSSLPFLFCHCILLWLACNYLLNFYQTDYGIMQISFICNISSWLCTLSLGSGCLRLILVLPFIKCGPLGNWVSLCLSFFIQENKNNAYSLWLRKGSKKLINVKCLE